MAEARTTARIGSRFSPGLRDLLVVGLPLAALYLRTGARDLGTIDSGELATVCARLGIAHPTGYPIYTLLGRLAVLLWPGPPIVAVTLLSSAIAVLAALAVAALMREISRGTSIPPWSSWAAALWFGCDRVFWEQATGNEVYGLHLLFVVLLLRQGFRLLRAEAGPRDLLQTAYLLGLAFAHHLSTVFLLPALAIALGFYLTRPGALGQKGAAGPRVLLSSLGLALLAWSVILFLPLRSLRDPIPDWGAPHVWDRFWRHTMASQYRVWMFESGKLWAQNLGTYFVSLPGRLWWPLLALVVPGAWLLARSRARRLLILGLVGLTTLAWAASYDIHDIETYFLPADLVFALLAALGMAWLNQTWWRRLRRPGLASRISPVLGALGGVLAMAQMGLHFKEADRRDDHFVRTHVETMLRSLPPRAVLLSRHWDALVSASFYLQEIEGLRRDVTVVDVELLRRSWYYPQLRRCDPTLLPPLEDRVTRFQTQLALFERGKPYEPAVIEGCYQAVIQGIAQLHRPERPTAFTPEVAATFVGSSAPIPEGLAYVLYNDPAASGPCDPPDVERLLRSGYRQDDDVHRAVIEGWLQILQARVRYLETCNRASEIPPWQAAVDRLMPFLKKR